MAVFISHGVMLPKSCDKLSYSFTLDKHSNSLSVTCKTGLVCKESVMVHSQDPEVLQYEGPGLQEAPESWDESEVFRTAEAAQGWESGGIGTYPPYK